jgi:hypothetical protein
MFNKNNKKDLDVIADYFTLISITLLLIAAIVASILGW